MIAEVRIATQTHPLYGKSEKQVALQICLARVLCPIRSGNFCFISHPHGLIPIMPIRISVKSFGSPTAKKSAKFYLAKCFPKLLDPRPSLCPTLRASEQTLGFLT